MLFLSHEVKKLAEFIRHKKNFSNFVLGEHDDYCLHCFSSLSTIKVQLFRSNHHIIIFRRTHVIYVGKDVSDTKEQGDVVLGQGNITLKANKVIIRNSTKVPLGTKLKIGN